MEALAPSRVGVRTERYARLLTRLLNKYSDLELRDHRSALRLTADYEVHELALNADDWLIERPLADLALPSEGVLVLAIQRHDGEFVGTPGDNAMLRAGDTVYLYGRATVLEALDHRTRNAEGDREHERIMREQRAILQRLGTRARSAFRGGASG